MISQLIYTSAPSGLSPGSSGYCTVQSSRGIPAPTVDLLESLSGYRHLFTPGSPEAKNNPVNYGHYILRISGKKEHVLSRVSDCDLDHTGRSNKLAHHMIVDKYSSVKGGSAWLLQQPGWLVDQWDGEVKLIDAAPALPTQSRPVAKCTTWETVCGDAGWAGVMAQAFLDDPQRKVFLIYQPGIDVLALFEEAISLLPESRRWDVTFSTYAAALPSTVDCLWTGITADSQEVHLSKRFVNAMRIDLPTLSGSAPAGLLVDVARTGKPPSKPVAPPAPPKEKAANSPVIKEPKLEADTYQIADPQLKPSTTPNLPPSIPLRKKTKKKSSLKRYLVLLTVLCFIAGGGAYAYINQQNANKAQLLAELDKEHSPEIPEEVSTAITPDDSTVKPFQQDIPETDAESTTGKNMEGKEDLAPEPQDEPGESDAPKDKKPEPDPDVKKADKKKDDPSVNLQVFYALRDLNFHSGKSIADHLEDGWDTSVPSLDEVNMSVLFTELQDPNYLAKIKATTIKEKSRIVVEISQVDSSGFTQEIARVELTKRVKSPVSLTVVAKSSGPEYTQLLKGLGVRLTWNGITKIIVLNCPITTKNCTLDMDTTDNHFQVVTSEEDTMRLKKIFAPNTVVSMAGNALTVSFKQEAYLLQRKENGMFVPENKHLGLFDYVTFSFEDSSETTKGINSHRYFSYKLACEKLDQKIANLKNKILKEAGNLTKSNQWKNFKGDDLILELVSNTSLINPFDEYSDEHNVRFTESIKSLKEVVTKRINKIKESNENYENLMSYKKGMKYSDYIEEMERLWNSKSDLNKSLDIKKSFVLTSGVIRSNLISIDDTSNSYPYDIVRITESVD